MSDNRIKVLPATKCSRIAGDWGELTWNASAELGNASELTVGQCRLYPGQKNPLHQHPNCEEVLVVTQGTISHTVKGGEVAILKCNDTVTIPRGILHQAHNIGDKDAILFIAFSSPQRETQGE